MIVLDLPIPISVNATRRKDWTTHAAARAWMRAADNALMGKLPPAIIGPFEIHILVSNKCRNDLDNCAKSVIDYCDRIDLIEARLIAPEEESVT